ncbi:PREDICTED: lysosomal alpha-glucosidase-like [Nanorana parkeri]|uniref:lysosomal alpha-glucosidase-like n=1 Tax=Nanorana parkeri TaxID=125878 RepID=UPI0008541E71|nr:PREDICTED: lysosomal alpha-glucosidase-like [Nanorana parkeri]
MAWTFCIFLMIWTVCRGENASKCSAAPNNRFDCAPEKILNEEECEARGCCYISDDSLGTGQPACFFPPDYPNYKMTDFTETNYGYTAILSRMKHTFMPNDLMKLRMDVFFETQYRLRIIIKDAIQKRYEVPIETPQVTEKADPVQYDVQFTNESFGFRVSRKCNGNVLVDTNIAPFIFADQFIQMSTSLSSSYVYGLGEHLTSINLDLEWKKLTFWNRDLIPRKDANLYGSHPFYLSFEKGGSAYGVFLLNSNAMDIILQPAPALTWRTIGGIVDMYLFMGPDPKTVIKQYQEVIGFPFMPPYWAFGFHLCRWGYNSSAMTREAVEKTRAAGIPLEVQWNDIDYMDAYRDFTYDPDHFGDLPEMVNDLHDMGMKYVAIMEPAIGNSSPPGSYPPYEDGLQRGIYVTNETGQPLVGKVWPGNTVFVDFTNPEAHKWWHDMFKAFHDKVPFDGAWIDMNEPANNVHGSLNGCPDNSIENPPYVPDVVGKVLRDTTICASSYQNISSHYNLHNMYGLFEAIATHDALVKIRNKRPFVISRSNFPTLGRYAGHWTGDLESTWEQLYYTIPAIVLCNMYGIPLVGADLCGFVGDASEELCVRWSQVGAFYPFMRNHNTKDAKSQEPYVFSKKAVDAIRKATLARYMLLPYMYTLFYKSHMSGETVVRAPFMEFPHDQNTWTIDHQFMWGEALLITPVVEQGKTVVTGYFPAGMWYSPVRGTGFESKGEWKTFPAPLDTIHYHIRGGYIIPAQEPAMTTTEMRRNGLILMVALTKDGAARGELYWDDGDSLDTYERGDYSLITFSAQDNTLASKVVKLEKEAESLKLKVVGLFGIANIPKEILINGAPALDYQYLQNEQYLKIQQLDLPLGREFEIQWSFSSSSVKVDL